MNTPSYFAGVDVSKPYLDVHLLPTAQAHRFANNSIGHRELIGLLRRHHVSLTVLEATGGYERAAVVALVQAGLKVHVAQPQIVHAFAVSLKLRAKNDKIDAAVCARYAQDRGHELRVIDAIDPTRQTLQALVARRDQLVQMQTMEQNRLQQADDKDARKSVQRSLNWMQRQIAKVEKQIDTLIARDAALHAKSQALRQAHGVGPQTTRVLLACLPELGQETPKRLNALVGVAPYAHDSGDRSAPRRIHGGRALVRGGLYTACLTAAFRDPVLSAHYRQLTQRGLAHKTAMMACIRKLLAHLDKLVRAALTPPTPPLLPSTP